MAPADLKAWREARGLTQREAAERLKVGRVTYSRWERGTQTIPALIDPALIGAELVGLVQWAAVKARKEVGEQIGEYRVEIAIARKPSDVVPGGEVNDATLTRVWLPTREGLAERLLGLLDELGELGSESPAAAPPAKLERIKANPELAARADPTEASN